MVFYHGVDVRRRAGEWGRINNVRFRIVKRAVIVLRQSDHIHVLDAPHEEAGAVLLQFTERRLHAAIARPVRETIDFILKPQTTH